MPARNRPYAGRPWTPDVVRARIKTTLIVKKLQDHVLGKAEMLPTQIQAAVALLRKVIPDTVSSSVTVTHRKRVTYADRFKDPASASVSPPAEAVEHTVQ